MRDLGDDVAGDEVAFVRTTWTAGRLGTRTCRGELSDYLVREIGTAYECDPERSELVRLHAAMLVRSAPVREQPVDAAAPVAAVEGDLRLQAPDPVGPPRPPPPPPNQARPPRPPPAHLPPTTPPARGST